MPIALHGLEMFRQNFPRRRTDFHIAVGNPFYVNVDGQTVTRQVRRQIVDEIMFQMAALLPPGNRGYYSDLTRATETYLRFAEPEQSNLRRAAPGE
jgi:hypothetical protein